MMVTAENHMLVTPLITITGIHGESDQHIQREYDAYEQNFNRYTSLE